MMERHQPEVNRLAQQRTQPSAKKQTNKQHRRRRCRQSFLNHHLLLIDYFHLKSTKRWLHIITVYTVAYQEKRYVKFLDFSHQDVPVAAFDSS